MNRQNPKDRSPSFAVTTVSLTDSSVSVKTDSRSTSRLIVLVPQDLAYGDTARRIWELAVATGRNVLLLTLCGNRARELSLRRQLVTMSALIAESQVPTE